MAKTTKPPVCLRPGCGRSPRARGLCDYDYTRAAALVRSGRTSWAALEAAGKVLPTCYTAAGTTAWMLGKEN